MLEYCARAVLASLKDNAIRSITPNADWYLDLVQSTWFPGWEIAWRDLCRARRLDPSIEVLAAVASSTTIALWLSNHYLWALWRGTWIYVTYEQRPSPYRICQIRACPRHEAVIVRYEPGCEIEYKTSSFDFKSWTTGTCQADCY